MDKNHFALEQPRKIRISISGYDAQAKTLEQSRKLKDRSRRRKLSADRTSKQQVHQAPGLAVESAPAQPARPVMKQSMASAMPHGTGSQHAEDELEMLNQAAAQELLDDDLEEDLLAAFNEEDYDHAHG